MFYLLAFKDLHAVCSLCLILALDHKNVMRRTGGVAQVAECLLSKSEALSSNPGTTKKKIKGQV
jgi:hypothetical protein